MSEDSPSVTVSLPCFARRIAVNDRTVSRDAGSPGHLQLLYDAHDCLFSVRKSDELETDSDPAQGAATDVLYRPHKANTDGLADGSLDQDHESVSDEQTEVIVGIGWKEFEAHPEDRDVKNTTLPPFRF